MIDSILPTMTITTDEQTDRLIIVAGENNHDDSIGRRELRHAAIIDVIAESWCIVIDICQGHSDLSVV